MHLRRHNQNQTTTISQQSILESLNSFDAAGSFAADIEDPGRVLPRSLFYGLIMVVSGYFFPLLVAIGASDAHNSMNGSMAICLARVTGDVIGPWLGAWTVMAAGISNIALFQAELSADAFQLMGMADRGHIPKLFSQRSKHNTPTYGVILGTAVIVVMGASDLDTLIEMLNFNYAVALLMEYSAFIKLRISRPDLAKRGNTRTRGALGGKSWQRFIRESQGGRCCK
jgi:amino acid transporter